MIVTEDGAARLWCLREDRFKDTTPVLDFHHASQHLWALAYHRFGEKTDEQKALERAWVGPLLHDLRHGKENRVIRTLEELLRTRIESESVSDCVGMLAM